MSACLPARKGVKYTECLGSIYSNQYAPQSHRLGTYSPFSTGALALARKRALVYIPHLSWSQSSRYYGHLDMVIMGQHEHGPATTSQTFQREACTFQAGNPTGYCRQSLFSLTIGNVVHTYQSPGQGAPQKKKVRETGSKAFIALVTDPCQTRRQNSGD